MHPIPAITLAFLQDGRFVQVFGVDVPLAEQRDRMNAMGQANASSVPGAVRMEIWSRTGVVGSTFFTPVYSPPELSPEEKADQEDRQRHAEEAAAHAARVEKGRSLMAELEQLQREGLKPRDLGLPDEDDEDAEDAAEAQRKADEAAAAAEAQRKADEAAAAAEAQRKADEAAEAQRKADEAEEAQRKADEAEEAQRKADEAATAEAAAASDAPLTGKKKNPKP